MKRLINNYIFNPTSGTIVFSDYTTINLEGILLITNVTDNIIMYNFASPTYHASVTGNVVTLTYNTSTMSSTDLIQIFYEDGLENTGIIKSILNRLSALPFVDKSVNRARTTSIVESGTVTTVTTCTTVTGMTNIDSYQGKLLVLNQNASAWANTVRSRIS